MCIEPWNVIPLKVVEMGRRLRDANAVARITTRTRGELSHSVDREQRKRRKQDIQYIDIVTYVPGRFDIFFFELAVRKRLVPVTASSVFNPQIGL